MKFQVGKIYRAVRSLKMPKWDIDDVETDHGDKGTYHLCLIVNEMDSLNDGSANVKFYSLSTSSIHEYCFIERYKENHRGGAWFEEVDEDDVSAIILPSTGSKP